MTDTPIALIGAGIGGTACALAMQQRGLKVKLYEMAPDLAEVGAGLTMSPNATRLLRDLGLNELLEGLIVPWRSRVRDGLTGELYRQAPMGDVVEAKFGAPYGFLHRADLLDALVGAVLANDRHAFHLDHELTDLRQNESGVVLTFANGREVSAEAAIGCDGIRSTVRGLLFGEMPARFTGNVAWRGLVPTDQLPEHMRVVYSGVWVAPKKHVVHYTLRGNQFMNYVVICEKSGWEVESWTEHSTVEDILEDFGDWHEEVQAMIKATPPELCYKWALFDRDPLAAWSQGRVSLLGDAAHPMLPFLGQGAAMGLEDGVVLARCFDEAQSPQEAFKLYEAARLERTTWAQLESREVGKLFHGKTMNEEIFAGDRTMQMNTLFGYDASNVSLGEP